MATATPPWERPATHLATVRGHRDIPVRQHGRFWWCSYEVALGIVWGGRDVTKPATYPPRNPNRE